MKNFKNKFNWISLLAVSGVLVSTLEVPVLVHHISHAINSIHVHVQAHGQEVHSHGHDHSNDAHGEDSASHDHDISSSVLLAFASSSSKVLFKNLRFSQLGYILYLSKIQITSNESAIKFIGHDPPGYCVSQDRFLFPPHTAPPAFV
jgi:hypothetical protein